MLWVYFGFILILANLGQHIRKECSRLIVSLKLILNMFAMISLIGVVSDLDVVLANIVIVAAYILKQAQTYICLRSRHLS